MRRSLEVTGVEIEERHRGVFHVLLDLSEVALATWHCELTLLCEGIADSLSLRVAEGGGRHIVLYAGTDRDERSSRLHRSDAETVELVLSRHELAAVMNASLHAYVDRWGYVDHLDLEPAGSGAATSDVTIFFR